MPNTALQTLPYPASTASPNVPADLQTLALATEKKLVQVYASAAARTSAFTSAGVTPTDGMLSYLQDVDRYDTYDGSAWQPVTMGWLAGSWKATPSLLAVTTETNLISQSWSPPFAGCYRIVWRAPWDLSSGTADGKAQVWVGGSVVDFDVRPPAGGVFVAFNRGETPWDFTTTAAVTLRVTIARGSGTGTINSRLSEARLDVYYAGKVGVKA